MIRNKTEIKMALEGEYARFVAYLNGLPTTAFLYTQESKWSAAQQLQHIVLSVNPLVRVFGMSPVQIEKTFGTTAGPGRSFDTMVADYVAQLDQGGKAPKPYLPEIVLESDKSALLQLLSKLIASLQLQIDVFTEAELDSLGVPHPLLGTISLREMLFNAIYHVGHHQKLTEHSLKNR
ncbi:DinB family protein [Maribacter sp.]|nr:DinB family protein [Maribacter sp.]